MVPELFRNMFQGVFVDLPHFHVSPSLDQFSFFSEFALELYAILLDDDDAGGGLGLFESG